MAKALMVKLDDVVRARLDERAAAHGRSAKAEVRAIVDVVVGNGRPNDDTDHPESLADAAIRLFGDTPLPDGYELPTIDDSPIPDCRQAAGEEGGTEGRERLGGAARRLFANNPLPYDLPRLPWRTPPTADDEA